MGARILYIEDELHMARIVADTLRIKGYEVLHLRDGLRVLEQINAFVPDLCLLDVMLPHIDGFSLGSAIRNLYPRLPIIFITAKSQTQDVLTGFSSGGTDYLRKPFSMEELMVRIDNQVRLSGSSAPDPTGIASDIALGTIVYSPLKLELIIGGRSQRLSSREAEILNVLCLHRNQLLERRRLLKLIWGDDSFFNSRNLDVYIRRLRSYLAGGEGVEILTLKGKGYHFVVR